jgi:hypothetical protein
MIEGAHIRNIICLEGDWYERDLRHSFSIRPILDYLTYNSEIKIIYRNVGTAAQLEHYLKLIDKYKDSKYKSYQVIYFAFHGKRGKLYLNRSESITLESIIEMSGDALKGRIVHFGSCLTMADQQRALNFGQTTQAAIVSGYTKVIDFHESSAFDMLYLGYLQRYQKTGNISKFQKKYSTFADQLGFTYIY